MFYINALPDWVEKAAEEKKAAIRRSASENHFSGKVYYVSAEGRDDNPGDSPDFPWRTPERVSREALLPGDGVLLRRGDLFRGQILCRPGVTYGAYGVGTKPEIRGWEKNLADPALWEKRDENLWALRDPMPDCGALVFNEGEAVTRKLIPSYIGGRFVLREDESRPFLPEEQMTRDLDLFCACDALMTRTPSHQQDFPVPDIKPENRGLLLLRCDFGNPGEVFTSIEAMPCHHTIRVGSCDGVHIDNLCIRFCGAHAISAGGSCVKGLHVTNCEIGWVGGTIQHYLGTDPNYPQGGRGSVTRYGNGIEIYGGCEDYLCENNYIYQVYDAGVTHQYTVTDAQPCIMKNVRYFGNLIENCVYSIEYFLSQTGDTGSLMDGLTIRGNILRLSGFGWGQQRHNTWTGAHIKSWSFENPARNYTIEDNIFDRSSQRLLHLVSEKPESLPHLANNRYIQYLGHTLGQFGSYESGNFPPTLAFAEDADFPIEKYAGDSAAKVYGIRV